MRQPTRTQRFFMSLISGGLFFLALSGHIRFVLALGLSTVTAGLLFLLLVKVAIAPKHRT